MIRFLITLLLLLPAPFVSAETQWAHLFTNDGIEVYRKISPETQVCTFKGVGFIDAGIEAVVSVIQDIPAYNQWVPRCRETRVLKEIDGNTSIFYSVVDSPPPYKDRDMVLVNKTVVDHDNNMIEISFDLSDQGGFPTSDNYVRVKELSGKYLLEYVASDKTRITFIYRGNPGGNIPLCIVNWFGNRKYPHDNIMGLRAMAKEGKYINAGRRFEGKRIVGVMNSTINQGSKPRPSIRLGQTKLTY